jgi:hypothetical protein
MPQTNPPLTPDSILQTAFGFWSSKVLLTAVEFGVFTRLGDRGMTGAELGRELDLHPRAVPDFFDALVAMKFLERDGDGPSAKYGNTPAGTFYLDQKSPRYVGGILVMLNARLFQILERSARGVAHRQTAERDQAWGQGNLRQALRRPSQARAIPRRDDRALADQL